LLRWRKAWLVRARRPAVTAASRSSMRLEKLAGQAAERR